MKIFCGIYFCGRFGKLIMDKERENEMEMDGEMKKWGEESAKF